MADALTCSAGCKREAVDEKTASDLGWELLSISQRWRCPDCRRELIAARSYYLQPGEDHED